MNSSLYNAIANIAHGFYDEYVEVNARFRARSGIKTVIIRREIGKCCDWCSRLAGIYDYNDAPEDIFRRHDNCKCIVTVRTEKGNYQDAWSKKEYSTQREARKARSEEIKNDQVFWENSKQAKRKAKAEGQRCFDVTEEWGHRFGKSVVVSNNKKELYIDGQQLIIDGRVNKYNPKPREKEVAAMIADHFGVRVELNPAINNPKGFQLSDYFIDKVRFDKKTPEGCGKHTIYNMIQEREEQAHSFVVDLINDTISSEEAIRQIKDDVFCSTHTKFVDTIILVEKDGNIRVFDRL